MAHLHEAALANSTMAAYNSAYRSYQLFCIRFSLPLFPLDESILQRYVAYLCKSVSYQTIKVYLAGIQYHSHMSGSKISITSMMRLYYLLRGVRRTQGSAYTRNRRQPITTHHLHIINLRLPLLNYTDLQRLALRTAASVAFFGLLRCSEYTCASSTQFDPLVDLMVRNVTIAKNMSIMSLRIKASKTDPFRVGCVVRIGRVDNDLCAVRLMHRYISIHPYPDGPLFVMNNTHFMTRNDVVEFIRRCFPSALDLNTHSFRIGGASAAASAGVANSTIQVLGRWSSDAYQRYLHFSNASVISLSERLAAVRHNVKNWSSNSLSSL